MSLRAALLRTGFHTPVIVLVVGLLQLSPGHLPHRPALSSLELQITSTTSSRPIDLAATTGTTTGFCQSVADPAYYYPGSTWDSALSGAPTLRYMVMNPASGPGTAPDPSYVSAVASARKAGVEVLGYAPTTWGHRSSADVQADIDKYGQWYGVTSIFLDEAATGADQLPYYSALADYVHGRSGMTALNFGTVPVEGYLGFTDLAVTFEGSYADYRTAAFPSWTRNYPPTRFWHLVYETPRTAMSSALKKARQASVANVFVTDDRGANPWDTLPTYWSRELLDIRSNNGAGC